jgi:hypothetical protein
MYLSGRTSKRIAVLVVAESARLEMMKEAQKPIESRFEYLCEIENEKQLFSLNS